MLQSRLGSFEGLHVADLFAGTGALGLEALSRGAAFCTFIDNERGAVETLKRNLQALGATERADLRSGGVEHAAPPARPVDLLVMDPPYAQGLADMALDRIARGGWLAPGAMIGVETAGERLSVPQTLSVETERRFGKAYITLLRTPA
jgi:16S rRNA (guanine966-N2)-methyltransferase